VGKSSSTPQTPDPYATAAAQTQMNEQTAAFNAGLNRYNQNTPFGSSAWTNNNGAWTNNQTLNPIMQQALTQQQIGQSSSNQIANQLLGNSWGSLAKPMNASGLPGIQSSVNTDFGNQINQAQKSAFDAQMSLYQPQQQQQGENLKAQLAAEGIPEGSEAYNNAINNQQRQFDFQNTQIANNAVQTGNALQNQLFGQSLGAGQFQNQANLQALQQQQALQNQTLSTWGALTGNNINVPQYGNNATAQAPTADLSSNVWNAYQGNLASSNAQTASNNQTWATLGSLGMAAMLAFSDRDVKKDIAKTGRKIGRHDEYEYRYGWEHPNAPKHLGVMAQEVEKTQPEAVLTLGGLGGLKAVDYSQLGD
jgi:hypothetical protein